MKKIIRLREGQLKQIIENQIKQLNEDNIFQTIAKKWRLNNEGWATYILGNQSVINDLDLVKDIGLPQDRSWTPTDLNNLSLPNIKKLYMAVEDLRKFDYEQSGVVRPEGGRSPWGFKFDPWD